MLIADQYSGFEHAPGFSNRISSQMLSISENKQNTSEKNKEQGQGYGSINNMIKHGINSLNQYYLM